MHYPMLVAHQAFAGIGKVKTAQVFSNRIFSVPLLTKEEIVQHIDFEQKESYVLMYLPCIAMTPFPFI